MQERVKHILGSRIAANMAKVIVGKEDVVEKLLVALFSQGNVLLEDLPGLGKTTLAKTLARTINLEFRRIQFTPDLLPSDLTGVNYFHPKEGEFKFRPGPLFAQIVLADEINRATPRTQSALLETMEERQVTVDGETYPLQAPFMVLATQNPVEMSGTFPLPEAQLDRFMICLSLGYPARDEEEQMLLRFEKQSPLAELESVATAEDILRACNEVKEIKVSAAVRQYILDIVAATRSHPAITMGASPRVSLALYRTGQALALLRGRSYVLPDDIIELAPWVMGHRMKLSAKHAVKGVGGKQLIEELIGTLPVPAEPTEDA